MKSRTFVSDLTAAWIAKRVRFHPVDDLLLEALGVTNPSSLETSLRFLVHPEDRQALAEARALGAAVAVANSRAMVCTPADGHESIVIVFPLPPLHYLFDKPHLSALDAALYFALQTDTDADLRLQSVVTKHALRRSELEKSFSEAYGAAPPLPAKEWLLRAIFDVELARARIAKLP